MNIHRKPLAQSVNAALAESRQAPRGAPAKTVLAIRPQGAGGTAEVLIYGPIGDAWFMETVDAKNFIAQLAQTQADELVIRINSPGGSVADGAAIYNAIRMHPAARKIVQIDGQAASVASMIAMAGDSVRMFANTTLMVHAPWAGIDGNENELRQAADALHIFAEAMATSYAAKSGKPIEEVMTLLTDGVDHYYTAQDAVAQGFADEIIEAAADPVVPVDPTEPDEADPNIEINVEIIEAFKAHAPALAGAMRRNAFNAMAARIERVAGGINAAAAAEALLAQTRAARANPEALPHRGNPAANPQEEVVMSEQTPAAVVADPKAAVVAAHAALRDRNTQIVAALKPYAHIEGIADLQIEALADPDSNLDTVRARALDIVGRAATPANGGGGRVETGEDARDKFRAGAALALQIRAGLAKDDTANHFRGHTLVELARASLEQNGIRTGNLSRMEIVAKGFTSTSDFPNVLANVANKSLLKGWDEAPETFQQWTNTGELSDFKPTKRVDLNEFPALTEIPEGAEYQYGTIGDRGETVQLATYGKMFAITRQAIINDDLGAFTRIPQKMGRAAKRTVGNLVYAILTSNPTMSDSVALFHATHSNLLTGAAIATASVDLLRQALAKQKDPQGNVTALNIPLKYLIVPVALGGVARQVANSEYEVGAAAKNNTVPNYVRGLFQVIEDARLDVASATGWYGVADPGLFDTVEVSYLDGQQAPYLEQRDGWDVDGSEFKVRIDAGVKALDFRTLAKNPGA